MSTHVIMDVYDFMSRLKALIPPRGQHQIIYFGVFSPACNERDFFRLVPGSKKREFYKAPKPKSEDPEKDPKLDPANRLNFSAWARHLKRTFKVDVSRCSKCGGEMKIMAILQKREEIARYLDHVSGYQRGPPVDKITTSHSAEVISDILTVE